MTLTTNINDISRRHASPAVLYDDATMGEAFSLLREAKTLLVGNFKTDLDRMSLYEGLWEGQTKVMYDELKRFLVMYQKEYVDVLEDYETVIYRIQVLLNNASTARVLGAV